MILWLLVATLSLAALLTGWAFLTGDPAHAPRHATPANQGEPEEDWTQRLRPDRPWGDTPD
jgi:hypothetical protein